MQSLSLHHGHSLTFVQIKTTWAGEAKCLKRQSRISFAGKQNFIQYNRVLSIHSSDHEQINSIIIWQLYCFFKWGKGGFVDHVVQFFNKLVNYRYLNKSSILLLHFKKQNAQADWRRQIEKLSNCPLTILFLMFLDIFYHALVIFQIEIVEMVVCR